MSTDIPGAQACGSSGPGSLLRSCSLGQHPFPQAESRAWSQAKELSNIKRTSEHCPGVSQTQIWPHRASLPSILQTKAQLGANGTLLKQPKGNFCRTGSSQIEGCRKGLAGHMSLKPSLAKSGAYPEAVMRG